MKLKARYPKESKLSTWPKWTEKLRIDHEYELRDLMLKALNVCKKEQGMELEEYLEQNGMMLRIWPGDYDVLYKLIDRYKDDPFCGKVKEFRDANKDINWASIKRIADARGAGFPGLYLEIYTPIFKRDEPIKTPEQLVPGRRDKFYVFLEKMKEAFPDKEIELRPGVYTEWSEGIREFCYEMYYPQIKSFLAAYGFTLVGADEDEKDPSKNANVETDAVPSAEAPVRTTDAGADKGSSVLYRPGQEPYRARNAAGQQFTARKTEFTYTPTILTPEPASPAKGNAQQEIPMAPEFVVSTPKRDNGAPSTDNEVQTVDFDHIEIAEHASPTALTCFGIRMMLNTWKELYVTACQIIYKEHATEFDRLLADKSDDSVWWIVRPERLSTLKIPRAIGVSCFIETYGNADTLLNRIKYIMDKCLVSYADVVVEYIAKQQPKSSDKPESQNATETAERPTNIAGREKLIIELPKVKGVHSIPDMPVQKTDNDGKRMDHTDIGTERQTDGSKLNVQNFPTEQREAIVPDSKHGELSNQRVQPKAIESKSAASPAIYKAGNAAGQIRPVYHFEIPTDAKVIKLPVQGTVQANIQENSGIQIVDFEHIGSMVGTKPIALHYGSRVEQVTSWASLYIKLCENIMIYHSGEFAAMVNVPFKENERLWLTTESQSSQLRKPRLIGNRYYIETNCNATDIVKNCKRILDACLIDHTKVVIEYRRIDVAAKGARPAHKSTGTTKTTQQIQKADDTAKSVSVKPAIPRNRGVPPQQVPQFILTDEERGSVMAAHHAKAEREVQSRRMQEQQAAPAVMTFEGISALVQATGNAVITNNLFRLTFEQAVEPDTEVYQLYFVDDMGKIISTKQQVKAAARGTTSTTTFSLQASNGFDSKKEYYLLILDADGRLKGKLPYQIKISFASDFDF